MTCLIYSCEAEIAVLPYFAILLSIDDERCIAGRGEFCLVSVAMVELGVSISAVG